MNLLSSHLPDSTWSRLSISTVSLTLRSNSLRPEKVVSDQGPGSFRQEFEKLFWRGLCQKRDFFALTSEQRQGQLGGFGGAGFGAMKQGAEGGLEAAAPGARWT